MYIGKQEITKEESLDNGLVKVTLKSDELDKLETETEEVIYREDILKKLKTKEPNEDETELRFDRCEPVIEQLLLVLLNNNVRLHDLTHIFTSVEGSIKQAQLKHERKHYGNNEYKRTIQQFSKEMYE